MKRIALLTTVAWLAACSSTPAPPDWQLSARSSLDNAAVAWLEGRDAVERAEFARARSAIARTARPDLLARAELHRCALRAATLQFEACSGFDALAQDATAADAAYARYLSNRSQAADAALLPPAHRAVLAGGDPASALRAIDDPITRLVAAGAALQRAQASPAVVQLAVDTASAQGWPRPLLAWLRVQQQSARAAGDAERAEQIQRRIDAVAPGSR